MLHYFNNRISPNFHYTENSSLFKRLFFLCAVLILLFTAEKVVAQTTVTTYTIAGTSTYTVPACATTITVQVWGAGGGGGGNSVNLYGAGGGGGGAYSSSVISVTGGATYSVVVGAAGAGGASVGSAAAQAGSSGGDSKFTTSTGTILILAKGGSGGTAPTGAANVPGTGGLGGPSSAGSGTILYSGGNGSSGNNNACGTNNPIGGGGGSSGGYSQNGNNAKISNNCGNFSFGTGGGAAPIGGVAGGFGGYNSGGCTYQGSATSGAVGGGGGGGGGYSIGGASGTGANGGVGKVVISYAPIATFSSLGTNVNSWVVPAGITKAVVQVWGAGGGGGGNYTPDGGGGGGGGGAFSQSTIAVNAGTTYSITVGTGGAGGATTSSSPGGTGTTGGDSWFTSSTTTLVLAKGGAGGTGRSAGGGGTGGNGGSSASGTGTIVYTGGTGGSGGSSDFGFGGGGGSSAGTAAIGGTGGSATSGGGCSNVGGAGGIAPAGGVNGAAGYGHWNTAYDGDAGGAGGAGSGENNNNASITGTGVGGRGGNGTVIVDWSPLLTIGSNTVAALSNINANTTNVKVHGFTLQGENDNSCGDITITGVTFPTTGSYLASDISNFKLYYTTTNTFATTNLLATNASPTAAGTQAAFSFNQTIVNTTYYYWITMDVSSTASNQRTVIGGTMNYTNVTATFASATLTADITSSAAASGTQTFTGRPNGVQTFTTSGTTTWTVPSNVCSITVKVWGAGGGGGGNSTTNNGGGGGGGGAYSSSIISVTPGATYTLIVGAGGAGGASTGSGAGGTGADSKFTTSTGTVLVLAKGGSGGAAPSGAAGVGGTGGSSAAGTGTLRYSGGNGSNGNGQANAAVGGGGGASAGYTANGNNAKASTNQGNWSYGTAGGAAPVGGVDGGMGGYYNPGNNGSLQYGTAVAGTIGGGGGGGGAESANNSSGTGAAGGNGKITISYAQMAIFSSTGTNANTWTVPNGVTSVTVSAWGAGGGGGGNNGATNGGSGGGGGAFSQSSIAVTAGTTYSITAGAGGAGGVSTGPANGSAGGDSWFTSSTTTLVLAKGGGGGAMASGTFANNTGGAGGATASGIGTLRYSGGNGGKGAATDFGYGGGGGSSSGYSTNGGNGGDASNTGNSSAVGGTGGVAPDTGAVAGATGLYSQATNAPDGDGGGAGGAGSGELDGASTGIGGNGGNGVVILQYNQLYPTIGNNVQAAATVCVGTTGQVIHSFSLTDYYSCSYATLTSLGFTTTGTYAASDISNFKLYYTTTNSFSTANLLATNSSPAAAGTQTFSFSHQQTANVEYYWITMDVSAGAGAGNLTVSGTTPQLISANYTPVGSSSASGQQTIQVMITSNTVSAAQNVCTGTAPSALTGTSPSGGSGSYTYLWESSTTGSTSGFVTASGTYTNSGYSPGSLTQDTWYRRTVTSGVCASNVASAIRMTILPNTATVSYWNGNTSNVWATAGNWCGSAPSCSISAIIPSGTANSPLISAPGAVCNSLTINSGATLAMSSTNTIGICGNWVNNGTFTTATGIVYFTGTSNQTIGGTGAQSFYDLTINNTGTSGSDVVTLSQPVTVTDKLTLIDGILATDATNLLTLTYTVTTATTGGNSTGPSFVKGPVRWNGLNGAGPFIFPTGKGASKWARIALSSVSSSTDFTCEYFNSSYSNVSSSDIATTTPTPTLTTVSKIEYWNITRSSGTGSAAVTLYWESASSSGINSCAANGPLKVAHYNTSSGNTWENANSSGTVVVSGSCSGATAGTVTSDVMTTFSPFTFGSGGSGVNPLPIELLSFDAIYNGKTTDLTWVTASEINNDYFTVERSTDAVNFTTVGMVHSKAVNGNSTGILSYSLNDPNTVPGTYYYRLQQTDFDGKYQYSAIVAITIEGNTDISFDILPNPTDGKQLFALITSPLNENIAITIHTVLGQLVYSQKIKTEIKTESYPIYLPQTLNSGTYIVTAVFNDDLKKIKKLVISK